MRGRLIATVAVLAAFIGFGVTATMALFTDQESIGANSFSTSSIDISVAPASALISLANMMPGDMVTDDLVVTNVPGSTDLRYAISASATNPDSKALKDQMVLTIKTIDVTTPATPCDNFDGTQLYTGDLDSTAGKLVGDAAQGAQAGDRAMAPGASETLCFRAQLPSSTGNAHKGASTTATFTFDAEQTLNNP